MSANHSQESMPALTDASVSSIGATHIDTNAWGADDASLWASPAPRGAEEWGSPTLRRQRVAPELQSVVQPQLALDVYL